MKPRNLVLGLVLLTLPTSPILSRDLAGQSLWDRPSYERNVQVQFSKPVLDFGEFSFLSAGVFLSVNWPLTERFRFVGELPMGYADRTDGYDDGYDNEMGLVLGNPYVGIDIGKRESDLSGQFGVRLPLAPSDKGDSRFIGTFSDHISRQGTFWDELLTVTGTGTYRHRTEEGFVAVTTAGAEVWFSTESGGSTEVFGLYGGQAGYENETWSATAGVMGRAFLSADRGNLGERTHHELGAQIGYQVASVRPTVFFRLPLDEDIREGLDYVVGLKIRVGF